MLRQTTDQVIFFTLTIETTNNGTPTTNAVHTGDSTATATLCKTGATPVASTNAVAELGNGVYSLDLTATETDTVGDLAIVITYNSSANVLGIREHVVAAAAYDGGSVSDPWATALPGSYSSGQAGYIVGSGQAGPTAAAIRSALGLGSANLDTQLAGLSTLTAAGVRTAIGEASANLDTQLAGILAGELNAAAIRAAVGMAAANLDTQLGSILAAEPDAAAIRAAVGLAAANLDTQLAPLGQVNAVATATARIPQVPASTGDAMNLVTAYDKAKTAAQPGDAMTLTTAYDKAKTAAQPGDAMTLTPAYDAAKTCAQPGQAVTLGGSNLAALGASLATLAQLQGLPWYLQQQLKICAELLEGLPS
jgi:hypothetical protein